MQSEILAHHPLNTVSRYCMPHLFTNGEPKTETAMRLTSLANEQDEAFCKLLLALFVTNCEFRAFEQSALLVPS